MTETKPHHGRNIKRFREWVGIKQDALAAELNWSQQKISSLEQKEEIEDDVLEEVARILKVPVDAIKSLDEEQAVSFVNNTFNHSGLFNRDCTLNFNPIEKIVELYERMLKDRDMMIEELRNITRNGGSSL